jgi:hypothetical protein
MSASADVRARRRAVRAASILAATLSMWTSPLSALAGPAEPNGARTFTSPDEAARTLIATVKKGDLPGLVALFGAAGQDLVDTSDPATGRHNREVFVAAAVEGWRLADAGPDRKELVLGNEAWPFPVPLVRGTAGWWFDAAAGKDEVLSRRIGRNELAVIRILGQYVAAQRAYAGVGHDGKRAGLYARRFGSTPGAHDGLYWRSAHGEPRSPLGVLIARASEEGYRRTEGGGALPLYGYYFRILEGQGKAAPGGPAEYVVGGEMSGGFALVAWPVHYGASGIMTFIVNQDGVGHEKDLGPETPALVARVTRYDPDPTWARVAP